MNCGDFCTICSKLTFLSFITFCEKCYIKVGILNSAWLSGTVYPCAAITTIHIQNFLIIPSRNSVLKH